MSGSQDVMILSRIANVRGLKNELDRLKRENADLRNEMASLKAHFSTALVAAQDMRQLSPGGKMILVDGWNVILGSKKDARSRGELLAGWRDYLKENPLDCVWVVFDGPVENVANEERLRVSYTGGNGPHRADRFICDYLRAAKYLGLSDRIEVRTNDRDLLREASGLR